MGVTVRLCRNLNTSSIGIFNNSALHALFDLILTCKQVLLWNTFTGRER
jgi:hypothetical protein